MDAQKVLDTWKYAYSKSRMSLGRDHRWWRITQNTTTVMKFDTGVTLTPCKLSTGQSDSMDSSSKIGNVTSDIKIANMLSFRPDPKAPSTSQNLRFAADPKLNPLLQSDLVFFTTSSTRSCFHPFSSTFEVSLFL